MDPRFQHEFTCILAGPSGCGKTQWVIKLIERVDQCVHPPPERIFWYYSQYQEAYRDRRLKEVVFNEGIPMEWSMQHEGDGMRRRTLLILDDLMTETNSKVLDLFIKGSHHWNVSCILITQNLFFKGKDTRTISLNTHYMVIFKNPRDASQISHLARQVFPSNGKYLTESFLDATKKPFGYLIIDMKPNTPEYGRLRTNIFLEGGEPQYVYIPR